MIKILSPGIHAKQEVYTHTCPTCMCIYSYNREDILYDYTLSTKNPYLYCPCCGAYNHIYMYIPYDFSKEIYCSTSQKEDK